MSNNYYKLYVQSVINLARTLCIKSAASADSINTYLQAQYGVNSVDLSNPASWKYYLNISGQYHPTDSLIYITSLDTQQLIPFTRASLATNAATLKAYQFGTDYYNELVTLNPVAEQLILGILYPADITKAIAAKDNTILSYNPTYIESNETNLIPELQKWIDKFKIRWDNSAFGITHSLYAAANLGVMYLNLVPTILNIRLKNCKTGYAHSFHVRQYLASHGFIDNYFDSMTLAQTMYFYRNIAYIERNNGQTSTFNDLVANVMTARNLPLAGYNLVLDTQQMPSSLTATAFFRKKNLNLNNAVEIDELIPLDTLLNKEIPLAQGNSDYISYETPVITAKLENSLNSTLLTKVIESTVAEVLDIPGQQLADVLFNHWLYLSNSNLYNVYIRVNNPRTGDIITLTTKDAFTYAIYAYCNSIGINIVNVPQCVAYAVQIMPTPTVSNLTNIVDINYFYTNNVAGNQAPDLATQIIGFQPQITSLTSTSQFYNLCTAIQQATYKQTRLVADMQDFYIRGMTNAMRFRMYSDILFNPEAPGTSYASWIAARSLPTTAFTIAEYMQLYNQLVLVATGADLNKTESLGDLQLAMVGLMQQLSSYSIQFVADNLGTNLTALNWAAIRAGNVNFSAGDASTIKVIDVGATIDKTSSGMYAKVDLDLQKPIVVQIEVEQRASVLAGIDAIDRGSKDAAYKVKIGTIIVNEILPGQSIDGSTTYLDGYSDLASYTSEQLATLVDIYGYPYTGSN